MTKQICILTISFLILLSCKKTELVTGQTATLHFSNDTVTFDTVFASIGSITKTLTIYNNNNFGILTNIHLAGRSSAHFRINIDGIPGNTQKNIEINVVNINVMIKAG